MSETGYTQIALTVGEPSGIGPDICLMLAQRERPFDLIVIGDSDELAARARILNIPIHIHDYDFESNSALNKSSQSAKHLNVLHVPVAAKVIPGELNPDNANSVLACLQFAVSGCLSNQFSAMVTGPVHKGIINKAAIPFTGHTEYLAELTQSERPVMMLQSKNFRVALATTHLPIRKVSEAITKKSLRQIIKVINHDLKQYMGISKPTILVCGLNPHAGEGGVLGSEEQEIIQPVIKELGDAGIDVRGALAADTVFTKKYLDQADVVLAMYHDQGLPVIKHQGFGQVVNITLGLPIIRTSVDHGTALELAGTGRAQYSSLTYALNVANDMSMRSSYLGK
jgi:4-hydroxythreonine-4-phosphate dehydrogenase